MNSGDSPFRWWLCPDAVRICDSPPEENHGCWEARYNNDLERGKRTTRCLPLLSDSYSAAVESLKGSAMIWSERLGYPVFADETLHGGGVQVTKAGGHLNCHLDYDLHPHKKARRALNLVAFVHSCWDKSWGGELYLSDPTGIPLVQFTPEPGSVVAFETSDLSYHGVRPVAPEADERVSVCVSFLCSLDVDRECDRKRPSRTCALFKPTRV